MSGYWPGGGGSNKGSRTWSSGKCTVSMGGGSSTPPTSDNSSSPGSSSRRGCPSWGASSSNRGWGSNVNGDGQNHDINTNHNGGGHWQIPKPPCGPHPPDMSHGAPWSAWPFNGVNPPAGPWPTPPQGWGGPWGARSGGSCSCPCDGPAERCTGYKKTCPNLPKDNQDGHRGDKQKPGPGDVDTRNPEEIMWEEEQARKRGNGASVDGRNPEEVQWEKDQDAKKRGMEKGEGQADNQPTRHSDGSYTFKHGSNSVNISGGYDGRWSYSSAPPAYHP